MSTFLEDKEEIDFVSRHLIERIKEGELLPNTVFKGCCSYFEFFDYSYLQNSKFIKDVLNSGDSDSGYLVFLDPSFRKLQEISKSHREVGIIKIQKNDSEKMIDRILFSSPTENPADSFIVTCHRCAFFSIDSDLTIYGERGWDIAISCCSRIETQKRLENLFSGFKKFQNNEEALDFMLREATEVIPKNFEDKFKKNYSNSGGSSRNYGLE